MWHKWIFLLQLPIRLKCSFFIIYTQWIALFGCQLEAVFTSRHGMELDTWIIYGICIYETLLGSRGLSSGIHNLSSSQTKRQEWWHCINGGHTLRLRTWGCCLMAAIWKNCFSSANTVNSAIPIHITLTEELGYTGEASLLISKFFSLTLNTLIQRRTFTLILSPTAHKFALNFLTKLKISCNGIWTTADITEMSKCFSFDYFTIQKKIWIRYFVTELTLKRRCHGYRQVRFVHDWRQYKQYGVQRRKKLRRCCVQSVSENSFQAASMYYELLKISCFKVLPSFLKLTELG